jgi:hypothetical protein
MIRAHRSSTTAVLLVCLLGTSSEILFANDGASSSSAGVTSSPSADNITTAKEDVSTISTTAVSTGQQLPGTTEFVRSLGEPAPLNPADVALAARSLALAPDRSAVFAQRGYRGYPGRNNSGAAAAMFAGAAAAIIGTALLVYANRPECTTTPTAGACGYGTKVIGTSVLSAGIVGITIGALTWK